MSSTEATVCQACLTAALRVHHAFNANCKGCCARAASRGLDFARVRNAGKLDPAYRRMLGHFGLTHDEVRAAAAADALGKRK